MLAERPARPRVLQQGYRVHAGQIPRHSHSRLGEQRGQHINASDQGVGTRPAILPARQAHQKRDSGLVVVGRVTMAPVAAFAKRLPVIGRQDKAGILPLPLAA